MMNSKVIHYHFHRRKSYLEREKELYEGFEIYLDELLENKEFEDLNELCYGELRYGYPEEVVQKYCS